MQKKTTKKGSFCCTQLYAFRFSRRYSFMARFNQKLISRHTINNDQCLSTTKLSQFLNNYQDKIKAVIYCQRNGIDTIFEASTDLDS